MIDIVNHIQKNSLAYSNTLLSIKYETKLDVEKKALLFLRS